MERELARRAVELALPAVRAAIADREICGAGFLHIVVMSPTLDPRDQSFEEAIVGEHSEGDVSAWDATTVPSRSTRRVCRGAPAWARTSFRRCAPICS